MHVRWFAHSHENRNDYLKYSLMKLHHAGEIYLSFHDMYEAQKFGYSEKVALHPHRHTSLLYVEDGQKEKKVVVDSEDSFVWMRDTILEADLYFCAGYNTDLHVHKRFVKPFSWQSDADLVNYRTRLDELIENYGAHFHKVRKFIPIGPNMSFSKSAPKNWAEQKAANVKYRLQKFAKGGKPWQATYEMFESRYDQMLSLRGGRLSYDVVLNDTLWGWPRHRVKLHQELRSLSVKYEIYSKLKWHTPYEIDNSILHNYPEKDFPIESVKELRGNYEQMLASSRLAVFATGFHWGWRNIMTLAFMIGLPVYMDPLLLEPYFDMKEFDWFENTDQWESLEEILLSIDKKKWQEIRQHNQEVYDKYMHPEKVGIYFVNSLSKNTIQA